jgi:hypothetical protein
MRRRLALGSWLVVVSGCATTPPAPPVGSARVIWPVAPPRAVERCQGASATGCLDQAALLLAAEPPDRLGAQRLLAAACQAELKAACTTLDQRFQPPTPVRIPALSPSVQVSGSAVLAFSCHLSSSGQLLGCHLDRSRGSTPGLDAQADKTMASAQARARLTPARLDGTPYDTELELLYLVPAQSTPGAAISPTMPDRPNVLLQRNRGEHE